MGADTSRSVGSKHKTCRRYDDAGHAHSLTFSCFKRQAFLDRDRTRRGFVDAVELARTRHALDLEMAVRDQARGLRGARRMGILPMDRHGRDARATMARNSRTAM